MKIILIVLLVFIIMIIAKKVSEQYKDKHDFYCNLHSFLCQFKINLSFKQEKVVEFLDGVSAKKQFNLFIDDYKEYLKTETLNFENLTFLDADETCVLEDIIKNIGKHDVKTEMGQVDNFIENINSKKQQSEQEKNKLCPMIIKLSFLFAIGLAILLI